MAKTYDLVVIGAGPGGYVTAIRAAQAGLHTAIVEQREVGGTCLNRGCIPTKALLHASHLYREMSSSAVFGLKTEAIECDTEAMYARKDAVVSRLRSGVEQLLESNQIELIRGKAEIQAEGRLTVADDRGERELHAQRIVIATGSAPALPSIPGIDLPGVVTSDDLLEHRKALCKKMVIIGGGVIGMEFATIFNGLGSEVSIIEAMPRILPTMDREISQSLSMVMKKRSVAIHTNAAVEEILPDEAGLICRFNCKGEQRTVEAEMVLIAIGRRANVEGLLSPALSLHIDRGIVVDDRFQTNVPGIYAIGDVICGGIQLAHAASAQGSNVVSHITGHPPEVNLNAIPACIYTDPEIACVGITEAEAKAQGIAVKTGKYVMSGNGKSIIEEQERGFIKVVFDSDSQVLLGAQLLCARATDLISELSTAIVNKLTMHQLTSVIRPHPTFSEGVTEAVENAMGKAIHIPPKNRGKG